MPISRRRLLANSALAAGSSLLPRTMNAFQNGAPAGAPDAYATPKPDLPGPVLPTWESLRETYTVPTWFNQAKFGIFIQCWFYIQHSCETMARHRIRSH